MNIGISSNTAIIPTFNGCMESFPNPLAIGPISILLALSTAKRFGGIIVINAGRAEMLSM